MLKRATLLVPFILLAGCGVGLNQSLLGNQTTALDAASLRGPTYGHLDIEKYLRSSSSSLGNLPLANPYASGTATPPPVPSDPSSITAQADMSAMSDVAIFAAIDANENLIADTFEITTAGGRVRHSQSWLNRVDAAEAAHPELKDQGEWIKSVSSKDVAAVHAAFRKFYLSQDSQSRSQLNATWRAGQPDDRLSQVQSKFQSLFGPIPTPSPVPSPLPTISPATANPTPVPAANGLFAWL